MKPNRWGMHALAVAALLAAGSSIAPGPEAGTRREVTLAANPDFSAGEQDIRVDGRAADAELGSAVAFGDVDGDGIPDLLMGERGDNRVFIYFGRNSLDPADVSADPTKAYVVTPDPAVIGDVDRPDVTLTCSNCSADARLGFSLAAGLIDGDGIADIVVGAPFDDFSGTDDGRAFIVTGRASWPATVDVATDGGTFEITSSSASSNDAYFLGFAVATGDPDGDGRDEIAVSSRNANFPLYAATFTAGQAGAVHLIDPGGSLAGDFDVSVAAVRHIVGLQSGDFLGEHMAFCNVNGDTNGPNPRQDLIVGAIGVDNTTSAVDAGAIYVFRGDMLYDPNFPLGVPAPASTIRADPAPGQAISAPIFRMLGADKEDSLGFSIACSDINADGLDDVIGGAFFADGAGNNKSGGGEAHVFYAPITMLNHNLKTTPAGLTVLPSTAGDQLGFSVAAGDMDCDGTDDILVGARNYDAQDEINTADVAVNGGITYVIRGGPRPPGRVLNLALGTFNPNNPGVRPAPFRNYPSTRNDGDLNLPLCDPANPDDPNNRCAVVGILVGDISHQQIGFASATSDFNQDGCDEVAVGALADPTRVANFKGRVYVVNLTDNDNDLVSDLSDEDDDNDCLSDTLEIGTVGTDHLNPDDDGDGLQDGTEAGVGSDPMLRGEFLLYDPTDPNFSGSNPPDCSNNDPNAPLCCLDFDDGATTTDPTTAFTDSDALPDGVDPNGIGEDLDLNGHICGDADKSGGVAGSSEVLCETDPSNPDTDGDGLDDDAETLGGCPSPLDADSDDDGLDDGTGEGANSTDPCSVDTDGDGLQDGTEVGITALVQGPNGQNDTAAGQDGTDPNVIVFDADPLNNTDPADQDTDDDCIPDGCIGACSPLPLGAPILQGEDVNLNGAVDGTIITAGTGSPSASTETDPGNADSDGDGLPDGLEWGATAASCAALSPATPSTGNADGDSGISFTDPRDFDTDDGGVSDGTEDTSAGAGATHNGVRNFDPNAFLCNAGGNPLLDTNNETNPNDATDDRGGSYVRGTPGPFFAQDPNSPNATILTTYIQNDLLVVILDDADENSNPAAADSVTLIAANVLDPNNANIRQGLSCLADDPNLAVPIDAESLVLGEVDPNTGLSAVNSGFFRGTLPMSTLGGGTGTLNSCNENDQVRFGYRDDDDLCDQRSVSADVTMAQIATVAPARQAVLTGSVTSIGATFDQDLSCPSISADPNTGNFRVAGTAGPAGVGGTPLTCQVDPGQPAFQNRRATLNLAAALPDDRYQVTMACDPAAGIEDRNGFPADCDPNCVLPASGNPAGYCAGVLSGDGVPGGTFTYEFIVDNTVPSVSSTVPLAGSVQATPPAQIVISFSEAIDANTINASTFIVTGTSLVAPVTCSYGYVAATRQGVCTIVSPAILPDDKYTVTLVGDSNLANPSIRDHASFSTQGNALNGGSSTVFTFVVDADSAPAATAFDPNNLETRTVAPSQVTVTFQEAMDPNNVIDANTILVSRTGGFSVPASSITYSAVPRQAVWDFGGALPDDRYTVVVVGDPNGGAASVRDFAANAFDGEFPCAGCMAPAITGDGTAGGNLSFSFLVDADNSPAIAGASIANIDPNAPGPVLTSAPAELRIQFAEAMDGNTIDPNTVLVSGQGGQVTASSVTYDPNGREAVFTFNFTDDEYMVTLKGTGLDVIRDLNGNILDGEFSGTFPTGDMVGGNDFVGFFRINTGPPTVIDTDPNALEVVTVTPTTIGVTFSEAMDANTITPSSFTVAGSGGNAVVCSSTPFDANTRVATCNITLPGDDRYDVNLDASVIKDVSGDFLDGDGNMTGGDDFNFSFVVDADQAPAIIDSDPNNLQVLSVSQSTVSVDFEEGMDASTIDPNTFVVSDTLGPVTPSGGVTYSAANKRATWSRGSALADEIYTVTVVGDPNMANPSVRDFAGNALDGEPPVPTGDGTAGGNFTFSFTVDANVPRVEATSPSCGATAMSATSVTVTFSEAMDANTIDFASVRIEEDGDPNNIFNTDPNSVVYDPNTRIVTITPDFPLTNNSYLIVMDANNPVTDRAGTALDGECSAGDPTRCESGELPSGNGTAGGDFACQFAVSTGTFVVDDVDPPNNGVLTVNQLPNVGGGRRVRVSVSERPQKASVTATSYIVRGTDPNSASVTCSYQFNKIVLPGPDCTDCNMRCETAAMFADDKITVTVKGDPNNPALRVKPFADPNTNFLDGEFFGSFPSGNGTPGGDFVYSFFFDVDAVPAVDTMVPTPETTLSTAPTTVSITFDQRMDPNSIDPNTFSVVGSSGAVAGTYSYNFTTNTSIFTAASPLADDTYTVTLLGNSAMGSASVRDFSAPQGNALDGECPGGGSGNNCDGTELAGAALSGNGTAGGDFVATFSVDTAATVTMTSPSDLSTTTGRLSQIVWTFDQAMNPNTLMDPNNVTISGMSVGTQTCDTLTPSMGGTVLTCVKTAGFPEDPNYTVTLTSGGILDAQGTALDGDGDTVPGGNHVFTFTLDTLPAIASMTPAQNSEVGSAPATVDVVFTEDMDPNTIQDPAGSFTVTDSAGAVAGVVSYNAGTRTATFTPTSALDADDRFSVVLDASIITDDDGNALDGEFPCTGCIGTAISGNDAAGGNFDVVFVTDTDAVPAVTGMSPGPGDTVTVAPSAVTVTFDQRLDAATLSTATFTVMDPNGTPLSGSVTWDAATLTATFDHGTALGEGLHTVTVDSDGSGTDVSDFGIPLGNRLDGECGAGNPALCEAGELPSGDGTAGGSYVAVFTVSVPPAVSMTSPSDLSTTTGRLSEIVWTFDQAMDPNTLIDPNNVTISGMSVGTQTCDTLTPSMGDTVLTCVKSAGFPEDPNYTVTLTSGGITDAMGTALDGDGDTMPGGNHVFTFALDTLPAIASMTPAQNSEVGSAPAAVDVVFTEDMDPNTILDPAGSFTVTDSAGAVAGVVSYNAGTRTATFTPTSAFDADDRFSVVLDASIITDDDGNALDGEFPCTGCIGTAISGNDAAGGNFDVVFVTDTDDLPAVTDMNPLPDATTPNASAITGVSVVFDQRIDPATLSTATFTVQDPNGAALGGTVSWDPNTLTARFEHGSQLDDGLYTVTLDSDGSGTDVSDFGLPMGNRLDGECAAGNPARCEAGELPSGDATAGGSYVAVFTVDFVPIAPPLDPTLEVDAGGILNWSSPPVAPGGGSPSYNLYRGDLGVLVAGGAYTQDPGGVPDALVVCDIASSTYDDGFAPAAPGGVAFYLVTEVMNGTEGTLGTDSSGHLRPNDGLCAGGNLATETGQGGSGTSKEAGLRPAGDL